MILGNVYWVGLGLYLGFVGYDGGRERVFIGEEWSVFRFFGY